MTGSDGEAPRQAEGPAAAGAPATAPAEAGAEQPAPAIPNGAAAPKPEPKSQPATEPAAASAQAPASCAGAPAAVPEVPQQPTEPVKEEQAPPAAEEQAPEPTPAEQGAVKPEAGQAAAAEQGAASAEVSDEALVKRLRELLTEVDLATTTEKMLRRRLEGELAVDLSERKRLLRAEVEKYLEEHQDEGGEEQAEEGQEGPAAPKRKRGVGFAAPCKLSEAMATFLGVEECPRSQVVKRLWEYIKAHDLQDPKNRRRILLDDRLSTIFPGKSVNMLAMNKHLTRHCFTADPNATSEEEEEEEEEASVASGEEEEAPPPRKRARAAAPKPSKPRAERKAASSSGEPKKGTGFNKPLKLSEPMAAWVGQPEASRGQITKRLWEYVKSKDLQDPSNKQFVLADEALLALTGQKRFKAFGFAKLIKKHLLLD